MLMTKKILKKENKKKQIMPKRRNERNILTFYEKIAVLRYYDETNISRNCLAKMFHCCATQIRRILEKKDELLQQLATLSEADASIIIEEMTRKRRKFEMNAISFILHQWVERCRQLRLRKNITNQVLKETALKMAAILNLPTFRPSYRWLNRFRGKYKYNEEDLGIVAVGNNLTVPGELSVEDIIIEFKDSLPSFLQKEICAITSLAKVEEKLVMNDDNSQTPNDLLKESSLTNKNRCDQDAEYENVDNDNDNDNKNNASGNDIEDVVLVNSTKNSIVNASDCISVNSSVSLREQNCSNKINELADSRLNGVTSVLLNRIFPHLAVIHQFAVMNSDVKALELISQLGVHMQTQAASGIYKQLTLDGIENEVACSEGAIFEDNDNYPDIDDIVLID